MKSIFVSSTFRDMQFERDMLHTLVIPELNEFSTKYDQVLRFSDLRWGVNTLDMDDNESSRKVLSVCLNEIEKCKPYMIIFIGERYGWIPDEVLIKNAIEEKQYDLEDYENSVTALEIEYGALSKDSLPENCLFYFRNPLPLEDMDEEDRAIYSSESDYHSEKLNKLKNKIQRLAGDKVFYYDAIWDKKNKRLTGLEALADRIIEDVKALFVEEFGELQEEPWQCEELRSSFKFLDNINYISGREEFFNKIKRDFINTDKHLLLIEGASGSGRTSVISRLLYDDIISDILDGDDYEELSIIPIICGLRKSTSLADILAQICFGLEMYWDIDEHFKTDLNTDIVLQYSDYIEDLFDEYFSDGKKVLIIIDGLEKLKNHEILTNLTWLPRSIYDNLKIVITYNPELIKLSKDSVYAEYTVKKVIPALNQEEERILINDIAGSNGKEIPEEVVDALCKLNDMDKPIYYSLIVERLLMMDADDFAQIDRLGGGMNAIKRYMLDFVKSCPNSVKKAAKLVILEAAERIEPNLTKCVIPMLSITKYGLKETDLEQLCNMMNIEYNYLSLTRFLKYMKAFFAISSDGYIYILNEEIKNGLREEFDGNKKEYTEVLYKYTKNAPKNDPLYYYESLRIARELKDYVYILNFGYYFNENLLADFVFFDELRRSAYEVLGNGEFLEVTFEVFLKYANDSEYLFDSFGVERIYKFISLLNVCGITSFYNSFTNEEKYSMLCSAYKLLVETIKHEKDNDKQANLYNCLSIVAKQKAYMEEDILFDFDSAIVSYISVINAHCSYKNLSSNLNESEFYIRLAPSIINSMILISSCYVKLKNNKEAVKFYNKAIEFIDENLERLDKQVFVQKRDDIESIIISLEYLIYDSNLELYEASEESDCENIKDVFYLLEECMDIAKRAYDYAMREDITNVSERDRQVDKYRLAKAYRYIAYYYIKLQDAENSYNNIKKEVEILEELYSESESENLLKTIEHEKKQLVVLEEIMEEE